MDYCGICNNNGDTGNSDKRTVRLKFHRSQLLYDIKNYAFVEADVMGEEKQHAQHVLAEIGIDNCLYAPDEYVVELTVPSTMSRTTMHHLSKLIHEFMVYCVLADWLSITNPQAAANWTAKAEAIKEEIEDVKNLRRKAFTRATHPW